MKATLPYAQGLLDINELHARELAAVKEGDLPNGRGARIEAAEAELKRKMNAFCQERYKKIEAECDAFEKETNYGENKKKLREWRAKLQERLKQAGITSVSATP